MCSLTKIHNIECQIFQKHIMLNIPFLFSEECLLVPAASALSDGGGGGRWPGAPDDAFLTIHTLICLFVVSLTFIISFIILSFCFILLLLLFIVIIISLGAEPWAPSPGARLGGGRRGRESTWPNIYIYIYIYM